LIDYARSQKKPMIFVTDDRKEDWWLHHHGKTIGPRPELIQEMYSKTGLHFYMYSTDEFLKYVQTFLELRDQQTAIEETRKIRLQDEAQYVATLGAIPTAFSRQLGEIAASGVISRQLAETLAGFGAHQLGAVVDAGALSRQFGEIAASGVVSRQLAETLAGFGARQLGAVVDAGALSRQFGEIAASVVASRQLAEALAGFSARQLDTLVGLSNTLPSYAEVSEKSQEVNEEAEQSPDQPEQEEQDNSSTEKADFASNQRSEDESDENQPSG
jgi:hypothetical protein